MDLKDLIYSELEISEGDSDLILDIPYENLNLKKVEPLVVTVYRVGSREYNGKFSICGLTAEPWDNGEKTRIIVELSYDGENVFGLTKVNSAALVRFNAIKKGGLSG